ncbi:MAG: hypothetical protein WCD04_02950 [Terriglobia bacterium]|jgi:hypothetical protein
MKYFTRLSRRGGPIADGHWKELPHHFFNRQSSIANQLLAPFRRLYPRNDCKPCRIGWDVQVETQEAVRQHTTALSGGVAQATLSAPFQGATLVSG